MKSVIETSSAALSSAPAPMSEQQSLLSPSPVQPLNGVHHSQLTRTVRRESSFVRTSQLRMSGIDELLAGLWSARGVQSIEEVKSSQDSLLPTSSMKNVDAMASYLADAFFEKKRVLIVADYDCDGATACSVMAMAFGAIGMNFDYLVPDRKIHGYGLTPAIVDTANTLDIKPEVIVTVDNGISSHSGIERANELGIDVLVTDHHLAPETLPAAKIIVNPNQPGCQFASKNIAGCGVAWYVVNALVDELSERGVDAGFDPAELLSYVAIGTVADVVKLDPNNRKLVQLGLDFIRKGQCPPGIAALAQVSGKNFSTLSCSDIGFGIGPRINAAGRLAHMSAGIECLTCLDADVAHALAVQLHETNDERKEIQKEVVEQAEMQAKAMLTAQMSKGTLSENDAAPDPFGQRSFVVYSPEWHEGVVGIVAGRIKEERHRPTVVLTRATDGDIKGSARSIPGFHLKHALDELNIEYPGVLLKFGGHAMAAGMTIAHDQLKVFQSAFEQICRRHLTQAIMTKTLKHDGALSARHFNQETIHMLSQQVWGQGFEEPVFVNELVVEDVKLIGQDKSHLKIHGYLACDKERTLIDVMAFGKANLAAEVASAQTIKVAFKPGLNTFRGQTNLQLIVELMEQEMMPQPVLENLSANKETHTLKAPESTKASATPARLRRF